MRHAAPLIAAAVSSAATAAAAAVPEQAGQLVFYTFVGLFGGGAAAFANAGRLRPALYHVFCQAFVGAFTGLMAGAIALEFAPDKPLWATVTAGVGGFLGPYGFWELLYRLAPNRVVAPPVPPPPPTGDPKP